MPLVGPWQPEAYMVDSVYDVLQVVLTAAEDVIPAANIWNMYETGTKTQYAKTFLYGLKGAHANQSAECGLGQPVKTIHQCIVSFKPIIKWCLRT